MNEYCNGKYRLSWTLHRIYAQRIWDSTLCQNLAPSLSSASDSYHPFPWLLRFCATLAWFFCTIGRKNTAPSNRLWPLWIWVISCKSSTINCEFCIRWSNFRLCRSVNTFWYSRLYCHGNKAQRVLYAWTETWLSEDFKDWKLDDY